ncbi:glucosyl-3-phosphoglycerate synthase [Baekduia soli]|uniref:4,4'-diaponeurosporenoate glycosyltransferase n=1 Tax=Baekduia soli TaxID=496014 RepID=A0A5B8U411_9ACTN|nr:glucosyl-3-phosphoglycerate synthase [Baekduia soli]QEC47794.1 glucosyl-3-phosphoglycerate synthase [Baekduia soli]
MSIDPKPLRAVVVIPARNEAARIGRCLKALAAQRDVDRREFIVILVLDRCVDATAATAQKVADAVGLRLGVVESPGPGVGHARRRGMDLARRMLEAGHAPDGLIACTDADTEVDRHWLAEQLRLVGEGARAIGGRIDLDVLEAQALGGATLRRREARAESRFARVRAEEPDAEHHFFSGASMAVTASAYRDAGGLDPASALEDEGFARRLRAAGIRIVYSDSVRVTTSARTEGRADRGLARDLELGEWLDQRRYDGRGYPLSDLLAIKGDTTISVVVPTRDCAATVREVLSSVVMVPAAAGLIDEVLVVDAGSPDGTAAYARSTGARVVHQDDLLPEHGPALGKGDAMWRGVAETTGDIVAFVDADTHDPDPAHLLGVLGPMLGDPSIALVKGAFTRPFRGGGEVLEGEGGRVTELMARPLLNLYVPELAGFEQPLAGETAARRDLLEQLSFPVGYGVEIAMLIDALEAVGLGALAEAQLGTRQNDHQSLRELSAMAFAVLCAVQRRRADSPGAPVPQGLLQPWDDGSIREVPVLERPPLRSLGQVVRKTGAAALM